MTTQSVTEKKYPLYEARKKLSAFCRKIKFDQWKGWIYLSPAIVLLLIFTAWPIINTVRYAFLEGYNSMGELGGTVFPVGLGNFAYIL